MRGSNRLSRSLAALTRTSPTRRRQATGVNTTPGSSRRLARTALCLSLFTGQCVLLTGGVPAAMAQRRPAAVNSAPAAPAKTTTPVTITPAKTIAPAASVKPGVAAATNAPAQTPAQAQNDAAQPFTLTTSPVAAGKVTRVTVNVKDLAGQEARSLLRSGPAASVGQEAPPPMSIQEQDVEPAAPGGDVIYAPQPSLTGDSIPGPSAPSPSPSTSYQGEFDEAKGGGPSGSFTIPPDTMGAVGIDRVVTHVNNNYVVHEKTTGARLSVVSIDAFWAPTGATGVFDPRVQYDRYNDRWLVAAVSNARTANSSVLFGISQTSDPQGTYTLYRYVVGCAAGAAGCNAGGEWADFPMLGYNKNWVAVTWNQFTISANGFVGGRGIVMAYPQLRAGTNTSFNLPVISAGAGGFCMHPATTYSPTEEVLYFVSHIGSASAAYRVFTLTGAPTTTPSLGATAIKTRPGGGWTQPGGDILPQTCVGVAGVTCPATLRRIDSGDSFVRSNVVFRNGSIWYPQTVGLPAGGLTRTAAQWTQVNTSGDFVDGGRIDDPTATNANGGSWYAYPSIAVNKNNDVLLGFSEFESDDFADAAYAFRLGTDPAGTMRDPVVYKEGEDYYSKAFSGTSNRWGDYSHSVVDPVNDRDLWTLQEYAGTRTVPTADTTTNNSRWATWWARVTAPAGAGDLIISEFRLHGPNGPAGSPAPEPNNDEFIEIYNASGSDLTVAAADGSAGYAVAASDGVIRCTIPNGTVIPSRGHYLCVNSAGYSLSSYPAGNGTTATGDATYTANIPNNTGIALFNTADTANFSTGTRLDAVGSTAEANALYKEGAGYPATTQFLIDHSFYRDLCGKGGSITTLGGCPTLGFPRDTGDNAVDFVFVDTNGTPTAAGQRLGAPGPENLSSPIQRNNQIAGPNLDATVGSNSSPNRVRDLTADAANNSTFGTLDFRKRIVNNTGAPVTRLRFRLIDVTTFPAPAGFADLRARTSTPVVVTGVNDPATCASTGAPPTAPCTVTVQGTTLEQPPSQANGGGFNSSLSAGTVALATPIAPGGSINVRFLLGIQQTGTYKFFINVEVLP